jgi:hypothetical protein
MLAHFVHNCGFLKWCQFVGSRGSPRGQVCMPKFLSDASEKFSVE